MHSGIYLRAKLFAFHCFIMHSEIFCRSSYFMYRVYLNDIFALAFDMLFPLLINFFLFPAERDEDAYFLHQILQELYEVNRDSS